jgi:hypothetical protein
VTAPDSNNSASGFSYATIDNPAGGTVEAGYTFHTAFSPGVQADLLTITVGAGSPSSFVVGFLTNVTIGTLADYPDQLRLRQSAGIGSGDTGLITMAKNDKGNVDVYFFRITGAVSGDQFTFSAVEDTVNPSGPQYHATAAGLLFSTSTVPAVPEPSSAALAGLGSLGLLYYFRRRRGPD